MRAIRTKRYKLIHNLNYKMPFPIDQDFYISPTFQVTSLSLSGIKNILLIIECLQDLLNRSRQNEPLRWYKSLKNYYYRPEWELYDLRVDPEELTNIAYQPSSNVSELETSLDKLIFDVNHYFSQDVFSDLKTRLFNWQKTTKDPWICAPTGVLEAAGEYKDNPQCMPLDNLDYRAI